MQGILRPRRAAGPVQPVAPVGDAVAHGVLQAKVQAIHPLGQVLQQAHRAGQPLEQLLHMPRPRLQQTRHALAEFRPLLGQPGLQLRAVRAQQFRRRRRGGGSFVSDKIGDGVINLVAHPADHRNGGSIDGPGHDLLIEGPQIFQGAAAPADEQGLALPAPVRRLDGLRDARRRAFPLHRRGIDDHAGGGVAPFQHLQDVPNGGARGRGHHADGLGISRQGAFAPVVKQPFFQQPLLEGFKRLLQGAGPRQLHLLHDELIPALERV